MALKGAGDHMMAEVRVLARVTASRQDRPEYDEQEWLAELLLTDPRGVGQHGGVRAHVEARELCACGGATVTGCSNPALPPTRTGGTRLF